MIVSEKFILDPACGSRMMWFDKENKHVVFGDIRKEAHTLCDGSTLTIDPDMLMDFTNLPFADKSFKLISWDPPHMKKLGANTWMAQKYGVLFPTWRLDIRVGFEECMTIKEAKALTVLLNPINPLTQLLLPEQSQKAVEMLRVGVGKKIKKYPKYFKI